MNDKKTKPDPRVHALVSTVDKAHGQGSLMCLGDQPEVQTTAIRTGSLALDAALGVGGYPKGRIVEIFGPESSGKTTLTLHAIAEVQACGGLAAFIDAEHAFDVGYAKAIGVDPRRLLISQPDCGEQALDIADMLVRSSDVDLVVIDSVAALVPKAELDGDMGDSHVGLHARLMSQATRKFAGIVGKAGTTLIFINQLRQKIGVMFGSPETTTGGQALKYYASVRLDVRRIGKLTAGDTTVGNRTRVKVVKNKMASPFQEAEFDIRWGTGIDAVGDLLDVAERKGAVVKNGSHYAFDGKSFAQGREKAREALIGSKALADAVSAAVVAAAKAPEPADGRKTGKANGESARAA